MKLFLILFNLFSFIINIPFAVDGDVMNMFAMFLSGYMVYYVNKEL